LPPREKAGPKHRPVDPFNLQRLLGAKKESGFWAEHHAAPASGRSKQKGPQSFFSACQHPPERGKRKSLKERPFRLRSSREKKKKKGGKIPRPKTPPPPPNVKGKLSSSLWEKKKKKGKRICTPLLDKLVSNHAKKGRICLSGGMELIQERETFPSCGEKKGKEEGPSRCSRNTVEKKDKADTLRPL